MFVKSLNAALSRFQGVLDELSRSPSVELALPNRDLDTGFKTKPGAYKLTDKAYAELLHKVTDKTEPSDPDALREDRLAYYSDPDAPISTKRNGKAWKKVKTQLDLISKPPNGDGRGAQTFGIERRP